MERAWKKSLVGGAVVLFVVAVVVAQAKATPSDAYGSDAYDSGAKRVAFLSELFDEPDISGEVEAEIQSSHGGDECGSSDCGRKRFSHLGKLMGLIAPSDYCFDDFVSPISNPLFFEDPRTLTEARLIFVQHNVPGQPRSLGGDVQYLALQIRAALSDRLSIIATKDGYIWTDTDALPADDAFADVAAGLKYNLWWNTENQSIWSAGFTFEADIGSHAVLQGKGDGEFHFFFSGAREVACNTHWMTGTGFRLPTDRSARSSMWYWSNHLDYQFHPGWYGLMEINWFHWMGSGDGTSFATTGFEGGDLFNLGSSGVSGNDIVTGAIGLRYKFTDSRVLGVGFEFPLTSRRDLLDNRIYADFIFRY